VRSLSSLIVVVAAVLLSLTVFHYYTYTCIILRFFLCGGGGGWLNNKYEVSRGPVTGRCMQARGPAVYTLQYSLTPP